MKTKTITLLGAGLALLVSFGSTHSATAQTASDPPDLSSRIIPDQYIAVFEPGTPNPRAAAQALANRHGVQVAGVYQHAIQGFVFRGPPQAAAALARNSRVASVEPDQLDWLVEDPAQILPWGIIRTDVETVVPIDGIDDLVDADVAIIDTGIDVDHPDLRVVGGAHFYYGKGNRIKIDEDYGDLRGHGTHVAGIVGAKDNGIGVVGVAPGVRLWSLRVFEAEGGAPKSLSIAALDWVVERADLFEAVNLSLGGSYYQPQNDAVRRAVESGVVVAVSAGNNAADAGDYSPASEPTALTVSAMYDFDGLPGGQHLNSNDDQFAGYSNFGEIVDICAPGYAYSTYLDGSYAYLNGTSMAAPHVAGAVALYVSQFGLEKNFNGVMAVGDAVKSLGWQLGEPEYLLGGDPDTFPEPLLNVGRLMTEAPPPPPSLHVADLDGEAVNLGNRWMAIVAVEIVDDAGTPAAGAEVTGEWSGGYSGSETLVTDADGLCAFATANMLNRKSDAVLFTVTDVRDDTHVYRPQENEDPDGDSDGTQILVLKP